MVQTPDKSIPEDIDAQYLFEHFDQIVKVTYTEVDLGVEADLTRRLDYEEDGLLSPVRLDLDMGSASMRKKTSKRVMMGEVTGIELFPMEPTEEIVEPTSMNTPMEVSVSSLGLTSQETLF